jgi:hypothetical protein
MKPKSELLDPMDIPVGHQRTSDGAAGIENGFTVPLLQALLTGCLLALALRLAVNKWTHHNIDSETMAILALVIAGVTWLLLLVDTRQLLWGLEKILRTDLDGDGQAGEPVTVERLVAIRPRGATIPKDHQPATVDNATLARFVADVAARGSAYRNLTHWPRPDWELMRNHLIDAGWAEWKSYNADGEPNTNQGWKLTADKDLIIGHISVLDERTVPYS